MGAFAWCFASALPLLTRACLALRPDSFGSVGFGALRSERACARLIIRVHSLELHEADVRGLLAEASPADHQVVLSDESYAVGADAAGAGVLAVLAGVTVELVWHSSLS